MRNCGYWVVCTGLLVPQLGCGGDADSADRVGAAAVSGEPGEVPTPAGPAGSIEPLTPGQISTTPGEEDPLTPGQTTPGQDPLTPGQTPTPSAPPPFTRSETGSCSVYAEFHVDTPLDDTRGTGFSAIDMLGTFNEQGPGTITWLDGTTTTLSIAVRAAGDTSSVDDPPRGEGYCVPFRQVSVELRIESADGRLTEDVVSNLAAVGYDGNIESIWLSEARLPLEELQGGLEVPTDWLIAGHTERRLDIDTAWVAPDARSPFCVPSDVPSTDPSQGCNVYTGVVRFFSSTPLANPPQDPADAIEPSPPYDDFHEVVGFWVLTR